jgi:hypothetical protein
MTRFLIGRPFRGDGITPRLTFVNKNMSLEYKDAIIKLLRNYIDYFT